MRKIKKGDDVVVTAGRDRGKRGIHAVHRSLDHGRDGCKETLAVGLDVVAGQFVVRSHQGEPPGTRPHRAAFRAAHEIPLADHAENPAVSAHHWNTADAAIKEQLRNRGYRHVGSDRMNGRRHDVLCLHRCLHRLLLPAVVNPNDRAISRIDADQRQ